MEDDPQLELVYVLDIPPGVTAARPSQLGIKPSDFSNPLYREAYTRVMLLRETDDEAVPTQDDGWMYASVTCGDKPEKLLEKYLAMHDGHGLERELLLDTRDGRPVYKLRRERFEQMRRLGFDVRPYTLPKGVRHGP